MECWRRTNAINIREIVGSEVGSIEIFVEKFRFEFSLLLFCGKLNSMHFDLNETKLFVLYIFDSIMQWRWFFFFCYLSIKMYGKEIGILYVLVRDIKVEGNRKF